jgi:methenyltetrahydromethanopterin cyclohydrolase
MSLNQAAFDLVWPWLARADGIGATSNRHGSAWVLDCGVEALGGSEAGLLMARAALGGLGQVSLATADEAATAYGGLWNDLPWPVVSVSTAAPVAACNDQP